MADTDPPLIFSRQAQQIFRAIKRIILFAASIIEKLEKGEEV